MNQQFEVKLLLKQNSEMMSRIQIYRRQNQLLIQQNHDLNLGVQNLSEVFAEIGAAWKTITNNEEALFNLMKKRGDSNSKGLISKYISHFRTFDEIIDRLGQKITNPGHSNEATLDAKTRLHAFVQNYEMFFKQIVDSYFKFNDEYLQWITELKNKPQLSQNFRMIANKEIQNKMKIKEFEGFMNEFRGRFKIYQSQNQHKLLDGILFTKNQQINSLKQLNQKLTRRLGLVFNYSTENAQAILQAGENDYECFCGGKHLQYFKKQWEKHLQELRSQNDKTKLAKAGDHDTVASMNRQEYELIQFEKQKLLERITNLQGRMEKMKTQSRLTEDLVINSSAYSILYSQTMQLIGFLDELLQKINNHYTFLYEIQKAREEEILELKSKLQKGEATNVSTKAAGENPKINIQTNFIEFKTNVTDWIKQLQKQYTDINNKISHKQEILSKSKEYINELQKDIGELNKKIELLQSNKNPPLQFRHQKFNEVEKKITQLIKNLPEDNPEKNKISSIWKEFIEYVKSRDKKIRDLQTVIKKREKDLAQKDKLVSVLQEGLKETESVFVSTQAQVKTFSTFITNTEKELHSLAEKNLSLRTQFEQQKILLNYKMKADSDSKVKMQEKLKYYESIDDQIKEIKKITQETELNYENWIIQQENKLMQTSLQLQQSKTDYDMKRFESQQKDKAIKKIIQQKQKWKSQCNKLGAKFNAIQEKSQFAVIKMQRDDYKRKVMCNCSRDQERSVVLNTCPHAFCKRCIQDMNNSRNRKCPLCGIKFGKSDIHDIILS